MKKKSFILALCTMMGVAMTFTSCTNDGETTSPEVKPAPIQVNYAPAKASKIYVTSGNQALASIGTTASRGYVDVNSNMWTYTPTAPTTEEINEVLAYIATKPEGVNWPGFTNFFIQNIGGAHHIYGYYSTFNPETYNGNIDGTKSMELFTIVDQNGSITVNNFASGNGNNTASLNCELIKEFNGFVNAYSLNEYSSSTIGNWRLFYWKGYYYLGFDFSMKKDDGKIDPDGNYDDWVVKIIPEDGKPSSDPGADPEPMKKLVEVNLAVNEPKEKDDYLESKLSIHVRDYTDVDIFIPIPYEDYCSVDDMFIVKTHEEGKYVYNTTSEVVEMKINNQTVKLYCDFHGDGIRIYTEGINKDVIDYLEKENGDGINFEIWNYYSEKVTSRAALQALLNKSKIYIKKTDTEYVNTNNNDGIYTLDCTVTRAENKNGWPTDEPSNKPTE